MKLKEHIKGRRGLFGIAALTSALLLSLVMPLATSAQAHIPGAAPEPELELKPVVVGDLRQLC